MTANPQTILHAPDRRARFNPGTGREADAPPAMIPKKKNLCVTLAKPAYFQARQQARATRRATWPQMPWRDSGRAARVRGLKNAQTVDVAAMSRGAWNPKARGLKICRLEGEKRRRRPNCGQRNTKNMVVPGKVSRVYSELEYKII